jgi:hypothetical protein
MIARVALLGRHSAITIAALFFGLIPAQALASPSRHVASREDVSSTHVALVAADQALRSIVTSWPKVEAAIGALDRRFAGECPRAGVGSPENGPEGRIAYQVTGALWAVGYHADANIAQRFIRTVSPLRWTDSALTRRLHAFITGLREMLALQVPDLCAETRAWSSSGFQTVPPSVLEYDQHVEAINVEIPSTALVSKYVRPADRPLLARVNHLVVRFEELEFTVGQRSWYQLLEILGLLP